MAYHDAGGYIAHRGNYLRSETAGTRLKGALLSVSLFLSRYNMYMGGVDSIHPIVIPGSTADIRTMDDEQQSGGSSGRGASGWGWACPGPPGG